MDRGGMMEFKEIVQWWSKYSLYVDRKNNAQKAREAKQAKKYREEHPNSLSVYVGMPETEKTLVGFMEYLRENYD